MSSSETSAPSTPSTPSTPTKSGITLTADGNRIIPPSVRADGSVRKEIRVRPGYRPPEDVEIYKNRTAATWKQNRESAGVPGAAAADDAGKKDGAGVVSNKNAKRKAARKKAKEKEDGAGAATKKGGDKDGAKAETVKVDDEKKMDTEEEKEKKAKAIRKKIRQATDLKSKKESGESLLPEQLDKIIKLNELVRQLNALGFKE